MSSKIREEIDNRVKCLVATPPRCQYRHPIGLKTFCVQLPKIKRKSNATLLKKTEKITIKKKARIILLGPPYTFSYN